MFILYAVGAAFATYFCMYPFRKQFAAATYEGETFFGTGLDLKAAFVISQVIGYTLSKSVLRTDRLCADAQRFGLCFSSAQASR